MLASRMRHRVRVEHKVRGAQDPVTGEITESWQVFTLPGGQTLESVPAEVLTGAGRELIAASAQEEETAARINMRWFPIDRLALMRCRVLWDGRVFNITSAETDATARREWRLRCSDGLLDDR